MNSVAILVVTYNRKELLLENIKAILGQTYSDFDLYIIDNASTDGTQEVINNTIKDKNIRYFNTGSNLGGAGGFAFGLKLILPQKYNYCWIMDDDTIPDSNALAELVFSAKKINNEFSFFASKVDWIDGSLCKMNSVVIQYEIIKEHLNECRFGLLPIKNCSFVGCFINVSVARKVGLPIKEFFIYGDDSEYTLRLSENKQGYFCVGSTIVHKIPNNYRIGIAEAPVDRLNRYSYEYRNRIYIYKNRNKYGIFRITYIYIKECLKVIFRSKNYKLKRICIICFGYFKGMRFKPTIDYIDMKEST